MAKAKILLKRFPLSGSICFFVRVLGKDFVCEIFFTCFRNVTEYIEESITYLLKSQEWIETKIIQKIQDKLNIILKKKKMCGIVIALGQKNSISYGQLKNIYFDIEKGKPYEQEKNHKNQ